MYIVLLVAVILRSTLNESDFVAARYVYAVNLVMFYLRILQLYYVHRRLGPKVVVIWRMVCVINDNNSNPGHAYGNVIIDSRPTRCTQYPPAT